MSSAVTENGLVALLELARKNISAGNPGVVQMDGIEELEKIASRDNEGEIYYLHYTENSGVSIVNILVRTFSW